MADDEKGTPTPEPASEPTTAPAPAPEPKPAPTPEPPAELTDAQRAAIASQAGYFQRNEAAKAEMLKLLNPEEPQKDPRVDDVLAELQAMKRDKFRAEAALEHKLPKDALDLLTGDTPEQVKANAEKLARLLKGDEKKTPPAPATDPFEQPSNVISWEVPEGGAENDPLAEGLAKQRKFQEGIGKTV